MNAVPTVSEATPAARIARFRRRAIPAILTLIVVFSAGTVAYRVRNPENRDLRYDNLIGATYLDLYANTGAPVRQEPDGHGGVVLYFEDFVVVGDHFERGTYRFFMGPDGRARRFQRD